MAVGLINSVQNQADAQATHSMYLPVWDSDKEEIISYLKSMPQCGDSGWSNFRVEGVKVGPGRFGYIASYFIDWHCLQASRIFEKTAGIRELQFLGGEPTYGRSSDTFGPTNSVHNGYYDLRISNPIYADATTVWQRIGDVYWMTEAPHVGYPGW